MSHEVIYSYLEVEVRTHISTFIVLKSGKKWKELLQV